MIPILYDATETNFASQGIGGLPDSTYCLVTEERNGIYELELHYPVTGLHYSDISLSKIIMVQPAVGADAEPFRIYKITKPLSGIVAIFAEHISYQLNSIPVMPFEATGLSLALVGLKGHAAEACPFSFRTDKTSAAKFKVTRPISLRSALGGIEGSILDKYGGEFEFSRYDVNLLSSRGADRGVEIRYGKNLVDLNQEESIANTVTGICPFWASDTDMVTLPERVVESDYASAYPYRRTVVVDFSSDFTEKPTESQLRSRAEEYVSKADIGIPSVSIEVEFVMLSQFEEFIDMTGLEQVSLCDTVTVVFEKLGINKKAKVVKTEYDVLKEKYKSITIGTIKSKISDVIIEQTDGIKDEVASQISGAFEGLEFATQKEIDEAIEEATRLLTGVAGGYIVTRYTADGHPYELLIMDTDSIDTATQVWRWNKAGLGHAARNAAGDLVYDIAITQDGKINADYILTGQLTANLIKAGVLTDAGGNYYLNMDSGLVKMKNAEITGGKIEIDTNSTTTDIIKLNYQYPSGDTQYSAMSSSGFSVFRNSTKKKIDVNENWINMETKGISDTLFDHSGISFFADGNTRKNYALFGVTGYTFWKNGNASQYNDNVKIHGGIYPDGNFGNPLGTIVKQTFGSAITLQSGVWKRLDDTRSGSTSLASITLTPGKWLLSPLVRFGNNNAGIRALAVVSNPSASSPSSDISSNPSQGSVTKLTRTWPVEISSNTTFYLYAYQNSGSELAVSASDTVLEAVKVG